MAIFEYESLDKTGRKVQGIIDADDAETARGKLRNSGLFPVKVEAGTEKREGGFLTFLTGISTREVASFTRQLATLVGAGFSISEALTTLSDQIQNLRFKQIISGMRDRVNEGKALSEVVREYPHIFPDLFSPMIRAGEKAGRLPSILNQLSTYQARQTVLRGKVQAAVAYPSFMFMVAVMVVVFLLTAVIPTLVETFEKEERVLPLITRILITCSDFLRTYWIAIIAAVAAGISIFRAWLKTERGREIYDRACLKVPVIGPLYVQIMLARFLRTFGILVRSDVPILTTFEILRSVVGNVVVSHALGTVGEAISKGASIARPLKDTGIFPPMVTDMISAGQKAGQLDDSLLTLADEYESDVESSLMLFTSILEPIIILVMGLVVGFIVLAMVLPLMELSQVQV